ncbi:hypothetical protein BH23CHL9_BH23CHL9_12940 [soil metagenome]|jgi:hypothetical protein
MFHAAGRFGNEQRIVALIAVGVWDLSVNLPALLG